MTETLCLFRSLSATNKRRHWSNVMPTNDRDVSDEKIGAILRKVSLFSLKRLSFEMCRVCNGDVLSRNSLTAWNIDLFLKYPHSKCNDTMLSWSCDNISVEIAMVDSLAIQSTYTSDIMKLLICVVSDGARLYFISCLQSHNTLNRSLTLCSFSFSNPFCIL